MRELVGRLKALDPQAGAAVQVIAYFDALVAGRAGLEAVVRGAAFLAGCPARLVDDERRLHVRVSPDGSRSGAPGPADPCWPAEEIAPGGPARVLLERGPGLAELDRMILERAAAAARAVLERAPGREDARPPVELLLDARAPERDRLRAACLLGLNPEGRARAVALPNRPPLVRQVPGRTDLPGDRRAGVGLVVDVLDLPASWESARTALRLTAEGTEQDPGPRAVRAEELGALAALAAHIGPGTPPDPDTRALERAAVSAPWMLRTLHTVAAAHSLRAAAADLGVHHSTLQARLAQAARLLGWDVREPSGRFRLQLALAARRLHRNL